MMIRPRMESFQRNRSNHRCCSERYLLRRGGVAHSGNATERNERSKPRPRRARRPPGRLIDVGGYQVSTSTARGKVHRQLFSFTASVTTSRLIGHSFSQARRSEDPRMLVRPRWSSME